MTKERFLLWMLAGIFTYQAAVFGFGLYQCSRVTPGTAIKDVCPEIGKRYDQTFNVMIATTLALLTGSVLKER
jgi:hypothetical protein